MRSDFSAEPMGEQGRPLCRRYALVLLDQISVGIATGDDLKHAEHRLWFANGFLADGDCEFLGCWPGPVSAEGTVHEVESDIRRRGVEDIGVVAFRAGDEPSDLARLPTRELLKLAAWPDAPKPGGKSPVDRETMALMRHEAVCVVSAARKRLMDRAAARRGGFADAASAAEFFVDYFWRIERDVLTGFTDVHVR